MENPVEIEVVATTPERQLLIAVEVPAGATVADAIEISNIAQRLPNIDAAACAVAIWGRLVERSDTVKAGDRIELLRPLQIDPREARRRLAEAGQVMGVRTGENEKSESNG